VKRKKPPLTHHLPSVPHLTLSGHLALSLFGDPGGVAGGVADGNMVFRRSSGGVTNSTQMFASAQV
jgi:hypothetical protein